MATDRQILNDIDTLAAHASSALKLAAMLRQRVLADGQPAPSRKGKRAIDPEIAALASMMYEKNQLKKTRNKSHAHATTTRQKRA